MHEKPRKEDRPDNGGLKVIGEQAEQAEPVVAPPETKQEETDHAGQP